MNLNVKLDEEEQTLQYVNRFAINLPPGATAFNLNIVNSELGNQSYILNPVNPVGQNIVAYQQPMAVQSYIALPAEGDSNILHSLPVGVPVPVGLPVPSGLLQNSNFVNTSIIIGNDECNSPDVLKTPPHDVNPENELKVNYIQKPIEEITNGAIANAIEFQNLEFNSSPQINSGVIKKPCCLEMSVKAANIDLEYEKCDTVPILLDNKTPAAEILPSENKSIELNSKVPSMPISSLIKTPNNIINLIGNQTKTQITWDNNNTKNEIVNNDFQESLICEVEEVNDDEDDEEEDGDEEEGNEVNGDIADGKTETLYNISRLNTSKENNHQPLSIALKLKKLSDENKSNKNINKKSKEISKNKKCQKLKKEEEEEEEEEEDDDDSEEWSESDDDTLNLKRNKNELSYKCIYEPDKTKSATSLVIKLEDKSQKFVRVRSCCSKKECGKKISVKDQKTAYKNFYDLESNFKRDGYLMNCIEHVPKNRSLEKENAKDKNLNETQYKTDEKKLLVNANIQLEIENESNGNPKVSDEIQNAIKESLRDCIERDETNQSEVENVEKSEKNSWNFYIVVDRCRRKVCLQFLLKLFRITKSRIKQLQKKILSGTPLVEDSPKTSQKQSEIWEEARVHLNTVRAEECIDCMRNPRHRFLSDNRTREDLFENFKEYYFGRVGREPNIKYNAYKRFLEKETPISFAVKKAGTCGECENLSKQEKRKQNKTAKDLAKVKEKEKKGSGKTDLEDSTDDEPLSKRKKIKLTIPLKSGTKTQQTGGRRNSKCSSVEKKIKTKSSKERSRQSTTKGRDVWSLMLLHLETMPYKECVGCVNKKKHRFLNPSFTTQGLFEDYRKYFLKETNSELGLGFTMYEKYFLRNCNYTISEVDENGSVCPRCVMDQNQQNTLKF